MQDTQQFKISSAALLSFMRSYEWSERMSNAANSGSVSKAD